MSMNVIQDLEASWLGGRTLPHFSPGDTVVVQVKVKEGNRERLQAFKFTWVIAEALEKLGFKQGAKINEYLKRQRSFREKMRREAEDVIHEFTSMHRRSPKAAAKAGGRPYPNLIDNMRAAKGK